MIMTWESPCVCNIAYLRLKGRINKSTIYMFLRMVITPKVKINFVQYENSMSLNFRKEFDSDVHIWDSYRKT